MTAIPLSTLAAVCLAKGYFWPALALALPAIFLDFLDGAVARASDQQTAYGNHLEAVVDRYVEGAILTGLGVHYPLLAGFALTFSVLVSYIKARVGLVIPSDNRDWPGVGDRSDRVVLLLLVLTLLALGRPAWAQTGLVALNVVAAVGTLQRMKHSKSLIEEAEREGRLLP